MPLAALQTTDCAINVHLLGHSTGAFVIREAFDDADDCNLPAGGFRISQVALIAGDISSGSTAETREECKSLFRHAQRLTNYFNRHDAVLKLSNVKRAGVAPRIGRVGLAPDVDPKAVDIDCSDYFRATYPEATVTSTPNCHSWHFGDMTFAEDVFATLKGDEDREAIGTRQLMNEVLTLRAN
jgi:hypothetical protein